MECGTCTYIIMRNLKNKQTNACLPLDNFITYIIILRVVNKIYISIADSLTCEIKMKYKALCCVKCQDLIKYYYKQHYVKTFTEAKCFYGNQTCRYCPIIKT